MSKNSKLDKIPWIWKAPGHRKNDKTAGIQRQVIFSIKGHSEPLIPLRPEFNCFSFWQMKRHCELWSSAMSMLRCEAPQVEADLFGTQTSWGCECSLPPASFFSITKLFLVTWWFGWWEWCSRADDWQSWGNSESLERAREWLQCNYQGGGAHTLHSFHLSKAPLCYASTMLASAYFFIGPRHTWGPIYGSECLLLTHWLTDWHLCANLTDVTLADEDTNPILIEVVPSGGQLCNYLQVEPSGGHIWN